MTKIGDLYRRMWGMVFNRPTNFSWVLNGKLAASGRPTSENEVLWLKKIGIETVLTLTEDPIPEGWMKDAQLRFIHIPILDHTAPSFEKISKAVDFIEDNIRQKRPVLVHCAAGIGRTGTILASYLVKYCGMMPDESISFIRRVRPGSIENPFQVEAIRSFFEVLNSKRK